MSETTRDPEPLPNEPSRELQRAQEARLGKVWEPPTGLRYWSTVNNTTVGVWYTATTFLFFLFGGVLAVLMRIQLAFPENTFLSAELYNQVFTVHGSVMMFLFAIPVFESIAVIFLPQMLGARDLPFPVLSSFGYWCFLLGGLFLSGSILFNAAPGRRLVHVSAADLRLPAGDRRRYVAARLFLHRGGGDRGGGGVDRRHSEMPAAGDAD